MMKQLTFMLLTVLLAVTLTACGNKGDTPNRSDNQIEDVQSSTIQTEPPDKKWSKQDILTMFAARAESDWTIIDCVKTTDFAFERIGVVLFVDNDHKYNYLAFMDADGYYALCGTECGTKAQLSTPSELTYRGNGTVTFMAQTEDGLPYECKITYQKSEDGLETNFVHEDDL